MFFFVFFFFVFSIFFFLSFVFCVVLFCFFFGLYLFCYLLNLLIIVWFLSWCIYWNCLVAFIVALIWYFRFDDMDIADRIILKKSQGKYFMKSITSFLGPWHEGDFFQTNKNHQMAWNFAWVLISHYYDTFWSSFAIFDFQPQSRGMTGVRGVSWGAKNVKKFFFIFENFLMEHVNLGP